MKSKLWFLKYEYYNLYAILVLSHFKKFGRYQSHIVSTHFPVSVQVFLLLYCLLQNLLATVLSHVCIKANLGLHLITQFHRKLVIEMPCLQAVVCVFNIVIPATSLSLSALACVAVWWVFMKLKGRKHEKTCNTDKCDRLVIDLKNQ